MRKQYGFSPVEVILIIVVVLLLGAVGYLFYQNTQSKSNDDSAKPSTITTTTADDTDEEKVVNTDPTAKWATFKAENGPFSMKFADGWAVRYNQYATLAQPSTSGSTGAATFTKVEGGKDAVEPFSIGYSNEPTRPTGTKVGTITANGVTGDKYSSGPDNGGGLYEEGTITYTYYFEKDGKSITAYYLKYPSHPDLTSIIEQMVKTISFN